MVQPRTEVYDDEVRFVERINRCVTALRLIGEGCGRDSLKVIGSARYLGRLQSSDPNLYLFNADFYGEHEGLVRLSFRREIEECQVFNSDRLVVGNLELIRELVKNVNSSLTGEIMGPVLSYGIYPTGKQIPTVAEGKRMFADIKASLLAMR